MLLLKLILVLDVSIFLAEERLFLTQDISLLFSFYFSNCIVCVICLLIDINAHGEDTNSSDDDVEYKQSGKKNNGKFFLKLVSKKGF